MNTDRIFVGNVMYDYDMVHKNEILVKIDDDVYVPLRSIRNFFDLYKIKSKKFHILKYSTVNNGYFYVDKNSLVPYYKNIQQKTLTKIKNDIFK